MHCRVRILLFSSHELKAQVSFYDRLLAVARLSVRLLSLHISIFFSRTTESISTKLGTKHPWVKGISVFSNEGPCPF